MRHQLHAEITIDCPPKIVWDVLTDLDTYQDWNPFIVSADGVVAVGERLSNRLQSPGGKVMTFKPTVTVVEPAKTFEWLGRLGMPGIFDGRHRFELHALPDGGTKLVHREELNGVLVRPLRTSLDTKTTQGFEAMNAALKTKAEAVITAHEPSNQTAFRTVAGDLTATGYRQTRPTGSETLFTYHAEAVLDPPLRWLARPIERLFNRRAAQDLRTLAGLFAQPERINQ